ncbi:Ubiquitin carboxyl-terminal hydrolase 13 [Sesamum angolense]|uniref:ubiquitinyl hydrolase 1 n=1 Tax=Sesamum angolense TaxID=2727404 RepID=A0AAE1W7T2_9LAMI|nr:Ubiquitin carboxyl-terminal hydrolase 13 [Sesamum angolense]
MLNRLKITWRIKDFSRLMTKVYSSTYDLGDVKRELLWKVLYNAYLKGTTRTTLNASMLITNLVYRSPSMILQLDVKGCHDVYTSFDKYVAVEHLDGVNRYHAGQYGLQVSSAPASLKRFEYEFVRDDMVKINDRYEFPLELDLDKDNGRYLSPEANRRVRNLYTLHSILVHSGGVHGGHYYAFIRPTLSNQWYKFDDERVTKEDITKTLDELYGGEEEHVMMTNPDSAPFKFTRQSNAYMLVYIRESDKDKILCDIDERDISQHLKERLKREQKEKEIKKKAKAEADMYMIVKVATDEDFARQIGNICFDLVDHAKVRSFRVQKLKPFHTFKEEIAREFRAPMYFQRLWLWGTRQNKTHRLNRPLTLLEESYTVSHLKRLSSKNPNDELQLFLEVERSRDLRAGPLPDKETDDILLFFKLYEPERGVKVFFLFSLFSMRYAGRLFVKSHDKPADILQKLNKLAGYAPNEQIDLFEEIKFEPTVMCAYIDIGLTFTSNQLEDGDIVWYQKSLPAQTRQLFRCPDIPSFLEYQHSLQIHINMKSRTFLHAYLETDEHASQAGFFLTFLPPNLNMDEHAHRAHYFCSYLPLELGANEHVIHFRSLGRPTKDEFCLQLSKLDSYDEVVERVANQLRLNDPSKLRLTSHNIYSQRPKAHPIRYRGVENLLQMFMHHQLSDILYFEVLDIPLPELQKLRILKLAFSYAAKTELETHSIRLPKESTVGDMLEHLKDKVKLSRLSAELGLLEVFSHKIYKVLNY